jgi:tripartite-type tricarboxylate transporter receptor subunit TctC
MTKNRIGLAATMLAYAACGTATAQTYPQKPIRFVVGFPAGGGADLAGRSVAQKLAEQFGQNVLVDNRPGASGNIAAELVAKSAPDGHTLFVSTITLSTNASIYAKLPFDAQRDFAPISLLTTVPIVIVVHPSLPARTARDLIGIAKARPGELAFASAGNGTAGHLSGEMFKQMAAVALTHVPYKGSPPALTDLLGGQVPIMFDGLNTSYPHVRAGKVRALAVTTKKRAAVVPDVPTLDETGLAGFDAATWTGLLAPAATPAPVLDRLNSEVVRALNAPDVKERLVGLGSEIAPMTRDQFAAYLRDEIAKWARVVKAAGIRAD